MREVLGGFFAESDASIARLLHRILDNTVDRYMPVLSGLETDSDEIEDALFTDGGKNRGISQRIYGLLNQVIDFQRACKPLDSMLVRIVEDLRIGALDASPRPGATPRRVEDESVELQRQFRDVHDHVMQIRDRLEDLRTSLQNALTVHDTLVAQQRYGAAERELAAQLDAFVPSRGEVVLAGAGPGAHAPLRRPRDHRRGLRAAGGARPAGHERALPGGCGGDQPRLLGVGHDRRGTGRHRAGLRGG